MNYLIVLVVSSLINYLYAETTFQMIVILLLTAILTALAEIHQYVKANYYNFNADNDRRKDNL